MERLIGLDSSSLTCSLMGCILYILKLYLGALNMQITGNISAVKKALLSVSGCLQDKPRVDAPNYGGSKISGRMHHGNGMVAH